MMFASDMYPEERIVIEIVATILCFILVRFMIKPYKLTREGRYLGLPLGFGFLGISFALAAIAYSPLWDDTKLMWFTLLTRTFAFVFLATTYFFFEKNSKKGKLLGEITISLLIIALISLLLFAFATPQLSFDSYSQANIYLRIFSVFCLSYSAII